MELNQFKALQVRIESAIFQSSDFRYYITVELDHQGERRRTDISGKNANPIFNINKFNFPIKRDLSQSKLLVKEYKDIVNGQQKTKQEKSLIGECSVELRPLIAHLMNYQESQKPIYQGLKFTKSANFSLLGEAPGRYNNRDMDDQQIGRFNISLVLIEDSQTKYGSTMLQNLDNKRPEVSTSAIQHMPIENPNFEWRVRIDLRAGIDMPLNSLNPHKMPSIFVEAAWSEALYFDSIDPFTKQYSVIVQENRHPHWNQQLIITNPPSHPDVGGFIWFSLTDSDVGEAFDRFYIPLNFFKTFKPIHLELHLRGGDYGAHPVLYLSLCLEKQLESFVDSICTVTFHWADFDPIPYVCKQFNLLMTTDAYMPSDTPYITIDLNDEQSIARAFQYQNNQSYSLFLTPSLRIPPDPIRNIHNSLTYFKMPKSFLDRKTRIFVIVNEESKTHKHFMPNVVVGATDILDIDLRRTLYSYSHEKMTFSVKFDEHCPLYRSLVVSKLRLDLACFPTEAVDEFFEENFDYDYEAKKGREKNEKMGGTYDYFNEKDRWQFLSKELQQKQEVIHRTMKDINDKSEDLKVKGKEILDLRAAIKQLKLENFKLHQHADAEERVEHEVEITKDLMQMSASEVKNKILKLAQAYKTQRLKNIEFEEAIKNAYRDLDSIPEHEKILENLQGEHAMKAQRLQDLQKETQKEQVFQETIKKQESVIAKLENLLERSVKSKEKARENNIELDHLKDEITQLQHQVKQASFGPQGENSELQRLRIETQNLERLLSDLKMELMNRNGNANQGFSNPKGLGDYEDWEDEKVALEIQMQRAQTRMDTMEDEMANNEAKFANEVNMLKQQLAEKNNTLRNMDVRPEDKIRL